MTERGSFGRLCDFLFGRRLATDEDEGQRIGAFAGVGVLGLDALASASYGPEALMTVLLPLGHAALGFTFALTGVTVGLLVIVALSYRQTIAAYPNGGGAYTVTRENIGTKASLFAAAALALDYLLNVAVAISAGAGALVSAMPSLLPYLLEVCLGLLLLLTLINLRGVRATGAAFMLPTYAFVVCLFTVIAIGVYRTLVEGVQPAAPSQNTHVASAAAPVSFWLLARAFANGCTALTGIEAVSNGVPIFRNPSHVGARRTLGLIVTILIVLLCGIAYLSRSYGIIATVPGQPGYRSLLSQVVGAVVGHGPFYYLTLGAVVAVLALSANASFADFPRVCRLLAADRFLPEPLMHRGRRLTFSYGIVALAIFATLLLVLFHGVTDHLIPLFAIGALLAFTMSQLGMVAHWRKRPGPAAMRALLMNATGAFATGITALVVFVSKFRDGAWIAAALIVAMLLLFQRIRRHYDVLSACTAAQASLELGPAPPPIAVVPIRRWDAAGLKALRFALGFSPEVVVVQILTGDREVDDLSSRWQSLVVEPAERIGIRAPKLIVKKSEYRQLFAPFSEVVKELARSHPERHVAVVVPQLIEPRWYYAFLHNHTAALLKTLLLVHGNPQIVIVTIPWYLRDWLPERSFAAAWRRRRFLRRRAST